MLTSLSAHATETFWWLIGQATITTEDGKVHPAARSDGGRQTCQNSESLLLSISLIPLPNAEQPWCPALTFEVAPISRAIADKIATAGMINAIFIFGLLYIAYFREIV
jgi:hypothetical protein